MSTPAWLTRAYIEAALRKYRHDAGLRIVALDIVPALGKGENYGGVLTRVRATYVLSESSVQQHGSYVVKTSFEGDAFAEAKMKPYDIFNREMSIYEGVLPKVSQLLREIGDAEELFATAVHVDYERQVLIFEDLQERGYVMADRAKCLDEPHARLILRKLAKMHAATAALNERENGRLEAYDRGFFNRHTDNYASYFVGMLLACADWIKGSPGYERYSKKLLALEPHYMAIGKRCFAPTPGHVNVLAHGDLWTNNVMFKYDGATGAPLDVLLIDFQYTFWGSPALDLHHFFNTSLQENLRLHEQDSLVQYYHGIFAGLLRQLRYGGAPVPTLHQFRLQFEQKRFFAFHSAVIIQPVMINEQTEDSDFSGIMAEDERANKFRRRLYDNKVAQRNAERLLPMFERRGLLEINQSS